MSKSYKNSNKEYGSSNKNYDSYEEGRRNKYNQVEVFSEAPLFTSKKEFKVSNKVYSKPKFK